MIEWCDPPELAQPRWVDRLGPLMTRPNKWAWVKACDTRRQAWETARNLRRGRYVIPSGRWEFVARQIEEGRPEAGIWARYLGPEEKTA